MSGSPFQSVARVRKIEDRANALHVHTPAQHEEREKSQGDEQVTHAEWETALGRNGWEHDEHALEEDGDESHHRDDHERPVTLRRPTSEALDEIGERNEPAQGEDYPSEGPPRLQEEAIDE